MRKGCVGYQGKMTYWLLQERVYWLSLENDLLVVMGKEPIGFHRKGPIGCYGKMAYWLLKKKGLFVVIGKGLIGCHMFLLLDYNLCFNGSPCHTASYYNYKSA